MRKLRERVGRQRPFVMRFASRSEFDRGANRLRAQGLYLVSSGIAPDGSIRTVWSPDGRYAGCESGLPEAPAFDLADGTRITWAGPAPDGPGSDQRRQGGRSNAAETRPVGWWETDAPVWVVEEPLLVEELVVEEPVADEPPVDAGLAVIEVSSFGATTAVIRELFAGNSVVLDLARADGDTATHVIGFFESYCRSAHAAIVHGDRARLTIVPA